MMEGIRDILKQFTQRKSHPLIQFIKYGIGGCMATVVDVMVFYTLAWKVLPALSPDDAFVKLFGLTVADMCDSVRSLRFVIDKVITFFFSNLTAYLVNVLWVFEPGRHKRWVEIGLFYLVSAISFGIGTFLGWFLIHAFGLTTTVTYVVCAIVSVMINYVCRKYLIFKG